MVKKGKSKSGTPMKIVLERKGLIRGSVVDLSEEDWEKVLKIGERIGLPGKKLTIERLIHIMIHMNEPDKIAGMNEEYLKAKPKTQ